MNVFPLMFHILTLLSGNEKKYWKPFIVKIISDYITGIWEYKKTSINYLETIAQKGQKFGTQWH